MMHTEVGCNICPHLGIKMPGIANALETLRYLAASLFSPVAVLPTATTQFTTDGTAVPAQQAGNLADGLLEFQEAVNLVSFLWAEVYIWQLRLGGLSGHDALASSATPHRVHLFCTS